MQKWMTGLCMSGLLLLRRASFCGRPGRAAAGCRTGEDTADVGFPRQKRKGPLVFVPLDTRPVSKDYTVATMQAAGWDIQFPPDELLSAASQAGHPDQLFDWLEEKSRESVAVVVSADSLAVWRSGRLADASF